MRIPGVALAAAGSLALLAAANPLSPVHGNSQARTNCARKFDAAQRQDMESFRDYDAEAFREVHHPDAASVIAVGQGTSIEPPAPET